MATVNLPSSPTFNGVRIIRQASVFKEVSPYTYEAQIYRNPGRRIVVEFTLPAMKQADAENWLDALDDLYTLDNVFEVDLSAYYSGLSTTTFRLTDPTYSFDIRDAGIYGISFTAEEVV